MNFLTLYTCDDQSIAEAKARFERAFMLPASHVLVPIGNYPERIERLTVVENSYVTPGHFWIGTMYTYGDIVCMECGVIVRHNPKITDGVSHGYCPDCADTALKEFETQLLTHSIRQGD